MGMDLAACTQYFRETPKDWALLSFHKVGHSPPPGAPLTHVTTTLGGPDLLPTRHTESPGWLGNGKM